jgi:hypothetical protein
MGVSSDEEHVGSLEHPLELQRFKFVRRNADVEPVGEADLPQGIDTPLRLDIRDLGPTLEFRPVHALVPVAEGPESLRNTASIRSLNVVIMITKGPYVLTPVGHGSTDLSKKRGGHLVLEFERVFRLDGVNGSAGRIEEIPEVDEQPRSGGEIG